MSLLSTLQEISNSLGFHVDIQTGALLFGLVWARILASLSLIPFLGGRLYQGKLKLVSALSSQCCSFPALTANAHAPASALVYFALLAKEVVIGSIIGLLTQIVFFGVQLAGILIDTQRAMNQITYIAPQLPGNISILGNLKFQAALVMFLALGGHLAFIGALATSFTVLPILTMPQMHAGWFAAAEQATAITSKAITLGFQIAAPVILAIFLVDLSFGCIGKVASQIKISNDSNTAKSWLGLGLFFLAAGILMGQLPPFFAAMLAAIAHLTRILQ